MGYYKYIRAYFLIYSILLKKSQLDDYNHTLKDQ